MAAARKFMVPELRREREKSSLDLKELSVFLDGGEFISETRKRMCKCPFEEGIYRYLLQRVK